MKTLLFCISILAGLSACKSSQSATDSSRSSKDKPACDAYKLDAELYNAPSDPVIIHDVRLEGKNLMIDVEYGGGCEGAEFTLVFNGMMAKSLPPQLTVKLHFKDNDHCRSIVRKTLCYDVSQINAEKSFTMRLEGFDKSFTFEGRD